MQDELLKLAKRIGGGLIDVAGRYAKSELGLPQAVDHGDSFESAVRGGLQQVCADVRVSESSGHANFTGSGTKLPVSVQKTARNAVFIGYAFRFLPENLGGELYGWALHRNFLSWGGWTLSQEGRFLVLRYVARINLAALTADLAAEAAVMVGTESLTLLGQLNGVV